MGILTNPQLSTTGFEFFSDNERVTSIRLRAVESADRYREARRARVSLRGRMRSLDRWRDL